MCVGLSTAYGPVMLVQVAGFLARRIVCRLRKGDRLARGDRFGMIRMGSKVDVYLPAGVEIKTAVGNKVFAGRTVLGGMTGEKS